MRVKHWTTSDIEPICEWLQNTVRDGEVILRLRNRKGARRTTIASELKVATDALRTASRVVDQDFGCQCHFYWNAIESWIADYLVEGARQRLLGALRTRASRSAAEVKAEPKVVAQKAPVDRVAQLAGILARYTPEEIRGALLLQRGAA